MRSLSTGSLRTGPRALLAVRGSDPSICYTRSVGHLRLVGASDITVLVLFLHHHHNAGPGSTLQLTSDIGVMLYYGLWLKKEKKAFVCIKLSSATHVCC